MLSTFERSGSSKMVEAILTEDDPETHLVSVYQRLVSIVRDLQAALHRLARKMAAADFSAASDWSDVDIGDLEARLKDLMQSEGPETDQPSLYSGKRS